MTEELARPLRSRAWFDNPGNPDMTALYLERYLNYGITARNSSPASRSSASPRPAPTSRPATAITSSSPSRVREGIREAGGIAMEFPVHPIQETGKRPTAGLDRNLTYLGLVELLYGYPLDGVVLTIGCDKTTPALLMAAATVNIPAIALSVGPMLNGWFRGERTGSGTIVWTAREMMARGEIDYAGLIDLVASSAPSVGYCNTMGTASTMNSLAEALGMQLPGSAAIPAPYRDRAEMAWRTGMRAVEIVREDLKPSDIMTMGAFKNAIRVNSAIGGSTNAPIHLNAIARHLGVELSIEDWEAWGEEIPLLVNLQPAGEYLGEDYYHAGGVPAVFGQLIEQGLIDEEGPTVSGRTVGDCYRGAVIMDEAVIRPFDRPLKERAGFKVLTGNIFHSAVMKMSVVSPEFRDRYLSNPASPNRFEGRAVVFDGPEDYHHRIDDPALAIDEDTMLFMRGAGPKGYPGAAEVVNMRAPDYLLKKGVTALVCIGDGRQSGHLRLALDPQRQPRGRLQRPARLIETGDRVVLDLNAGRLDLLVDEAELQRRRDALLTDGGYHYPESQTPWQEIQRSLVGELETGAVLEPAVKYQRIAQTKGIPRDNH